LAAAVLLVLQSFALFGASTRAHGADGPGAAACAATPSDPSHEPQRDHCAPCCIVCAARDQAQVFLFVAPRRDDGTLPAPRATRVGALAFDDRADVPAAPTGSGAARAPPLS
jgi:hypothetical protein